MDELLPVLVAHLADARARPYLAHVALANEIAVLPLVDPPVDATLHVVEVHTGEGEPLVLLAEPQGAGTEAGFPLRLRPLDEDHAAASRASCRAITARRSAIRSRRSRAASRSSENRSRGANS